MLVDWLLEGYSMEKIHIFFVYINYLRALPAWLIIYSCKYKQKCLEDIRAYLDHSSYSDSKMNLFNFSKLLLYEKSLRNVLLNRLHRNPIRYLLFRVLFKPLETLYINMPPEAIGGGLSFQHGFSTIVAAKSIGKIVEFINNVQLGTMA